MSADQGDLTFCCLDFTLIFLVHPFINNVHAIQAKYTSPPFLLLLDMQPG